MEQNDEDNASIGEVSEATGSAGMFGGDESNVGLQDISDRSGDSNSHNSDGEGENSEPLIEVKTIDFKPIHANNLTLGYSNNYTQ